ncbi:signal transduction protein Syg1 [Purpureocillium lavendulum]|uniref:Signal transduction protein Syg1 n=1 Tax=Purpureocillium lavendulum TaxID=1247861 RepID=A0AB34FI21_9HYPO|nr:signal transduction protein Syg1 [Purpureocillium lavendulum]
MREWRIKYLNYKAGKKYVKAVSRAINRTPRGLSNRTPSFFRPTPSGQPASAEPYNPASPEARGAPGRAPPDSSEPRPIPTSAPAEHEALRGSGTDLQYGSFVATPHVQSPLSSHDGHHDFELPGPAIHAPPDSPEVARPTDTLRRNLSRFTMTRKESRNAASMMHNSARTTTPKRVATGPFTESPSRLTRILSHASATLPKSDTALQQLDVVREREREFYEFMDTELDKVESFYKLKEEQAGQRLTVLREQLHEMRNRRIQEMANEAQIDADAHHNGNENGVDKSNAWVHPFKAKIFPPGPNSKALRNMPRTPYLPPSASHETRRDYSRRAPDHDVSYRTAKRKLKLALQEFYRGLELLKSYALLNRTAFRKLNKKFDKAANARPPLRYMNEKVNKAWFVNSDVLDGHIKAVEDLYARYFERGNHKLAAGKLRSLSRKSSDESGSSFLNGFLIGIGMVFTVQGVVYGAKLLFDMDSTVRRETSYLLQLYGGYFLMLLLFSLFCINCFVWTRNKVNYPFIFEFDQRSHIDWRRLAEFPSFFFLLLGIFMWMNFSQYGPDWLYTYYPVFLIAITALIIFLPAPVLAHKSRQWFVYAHWRLLLAGIYPVEFRDFFLGDMYCSLTYCMANIELFFCLYANEWGNPDQCNSNHSRLLGFLMTLPPIWRFLQCLRRYKDTRNVFPHLVNGGKYTMTIVTSVLLSLYRIQNTHTLLALYITFSIINSIYVCKFCKPLTVRTDAYPRSAIWDLFMDFSLLQAHSRHFLLRDILALKRRWPYYAIMVIDPLLRFAWIFYAIFTHNTQHSTIVSFMVSLLEITRRGMWALFRVENEHCANVSQYKASRDVPLPYRIEPLMDRASSESSPALQTEDQRRQDIAQSTSTSTAVASTLGTLRRRVEASGSRRFSQILAEAHKQDFEKRRKPVDESVEEDEEEHDVNSDDEEEDEDDEDATRLVEVREAREVGEGQKDDDV